MPSGLMDGILLFINIQLKIYTKSNVAEWLPIVIRKTSTLQNIRIFRRLTIPFLCKSIKKRVFINCCILRISSSRDCILCKTSKRENKFENSNPDFPYNPIFFHSISNYHFQPSRYLCFIHSSHISCAFHSTFCFD